MNLHDIRSLAQWHAEESRKVDATINKLTPAYQSRAMRARAAFHALSAKQLTELATGFEAAGKLLTNIVSNQP